MKIDDEIEEMLTSSGLPWAIKNGARHNKIVLCGKLIGILPKGKNVGRISDRSQKNVVAQIRRAIAEKKS